MSNSFFWLGFLSRLEYVFLKENDSFLLVFHIAQGLKKNFLYSRIGFQVA